MMKNTTRISQTHLEYEIYQTYDEKDKKNFSKPSAASHLSNR
jgi:hypothetical protein